MNFYLILLLSLFIVNEAGAAKTQKAQKNIRLLSFKQLKSLKEKDRTKYLRVVAKSVSFIERAAVLDKHSFFDFFQIILKAHAEDGLRCIGGGAIVRGGPGSNCGVSSAAGFNCPNGLEICYPLLFGVQADSKEPFCFDNATTQRCIDEARPGDNSDLEYVYNRNNFVEHEYDGYRAAIEGICSGSIEIIESRSSVDRACRQIERQTQNLQAQYPNLLANGLEVDAVPDLGADGPTINETLVKLNRDAAEGACLPIGVGQNPVQIFRNNEIDVKEREARSRHEPENTLMSQEYNNDIRLVNAARVVDVIDRIGDGRFQGHRDFTLYFYRQRNAVSGRNAEGVHLRPGNQNEQGLGTSDGGVHNCGLIAHEIGHQVGWWVPPNQPNGAEDRLYDIYFREVRNCRLTGYSRPHPQRGRVEEFAEVFGAYISNPALFRGKGENCDNAFRFFAEQFGETDIQMSCESRRRSLTPNSENSSPRAHPIDPSAVPSVM